MLCIDKVFTISGLLPHTAGWKFAKGLVVTLIGAAIGIPLARYAERDDAPGGVWIAVLIMVGAAAIGIRLARQRPESHARK